MQTLGSGTATDGTYTARTQDSSTGSGTGLKLKVVISSNAISSVEIEDPSKDMQLETI